jgi:Flp pilus assembly protein TadB
VNRSQQSALSRNPLVADVLIAVVIVAVILVVEPGVAIAAILALILLIVCAISFLIARRRPRTGAGARATMPPRARRR